MTEIKDVIPGSSTEPATTPQNQEPQGIPGGAPKEPDAPAKPPEGYVPLAALQEERHKRQELEREIANAPVPSDEEFSDEGKALKGEIEAMKSELSEVKAESAKKDVLLAYPVLKDKWAEFEEFRALPDNKGLNLRTAAKAFLVENGLLDVPRIGLEKPTGGPRTPAPSGMSAEDVKHLRETDFKKYQKLLMEGKLKIA